MIHLISKFHLHIAFILSMLQIIMFPNQIFCIIFILLVFHLFLLIILVKIDLARLFFSFHCIII